MDYVLERLINAPAGHQPAVDTAMILLAWSSEGIFIALVVTWLAIGIIRRSWIESQAALLALLGSGIALAINQVIPHIWFRPRPFVSHPGTVHVLLSHSRDASFPSDHAAAAFAIASLLFWVHRKLGVVALILALAICYARVYVGDHYPGDVLAGAVVGVLAAVSLGAACHRYEGTIRKILAARQG